MDIGTIFLISLSIITMSFAFCVCYRMHIEAKIEKQRLAYEVAMMYLQVMSIKNNYLPRNS